MPNRGQFVKGQRPSPATEFKPGQHWRSPKPFWSADWLRREYVDAQKSAELIAEEVECTANNILYWLAKHGIPRREHAEARRLRREPDISGPRNPMFGKVGDQNPHWKGGITAERQAVYSTQAWKSAVSFVWKRDKARCQRCKRPSGRRGDATFHLHHKASFSVNEARGDADNLVLLCRDCHYWVLSKQNRKLLFLH